jgi:hypothetical protein
MEDYPIVLMSEGDWTIEKMSEHKDARPGYRSYRSNFQSLLKHVCYPNGRKKGDGSGYYVHRVVTYPDDSTYCWRCCTKIPDDIKTVWLIHNWEVLQCDNR